VDKIDRKTLLQLIQLVTLFYSRLSPEDIQENGSLFKEIVKFRSLFVDSFAGNSPHAEHLVVESFTFNLKIPTLSALLSVPDQLRFIGPTKFLDTSMVCFEIQSFLPHFLV